MTVMDAISCLGTVASVFGVILTWRLTTSLRKLRALMIARARLPVIAKELDASSKTISAHASKRATQDLNAAIAQAISHLKSAQRNAVGLPELAAEIAVVLELASRLGGTTRAQWDRSETLAAQIGALVISITNVRRDRGWDDDD